MSTLGRMTRALSFGDGRRSSTELVCADVQVAEARDRVERLAKQVEDDIGRGIPTTNSRQVLALCQEILRAAVIHRDAVFVEFLNGKAKTGGVSVEAG